MLKKSDLEELGEQEVRKRLARGDYAESSECSFIQDWLRSKDEEHLFDLECARADKSADLDAKNAALRAHKMASIANTKATIALIIAATSAICAIVALVMR